MRNTYIISISDKGTIPDKEAFMYAVCASAFGFNDKVEYHWNPEDLTRKIILDGSTIVNTLYQEHIF